MLENKDLEAAVHAFRGAAFKLERKAHERDVLMSELADTLRRVASPQLLALVADTLAAVRKAQG